MVLSSSAQLNEQLMIALAGHASRESALQDERDSLFALLEAWGCCAVLTAPDGSICLATREAKNTLGLHNAPGGSWFDCIRDAEECTAARKAMRTVSCGDQQTASIPLRAGAGTEQRTWTLHPSPPGNGIPGHVVWMKGSD
ncbi:MAG: hypothetical protein GKC04_04180 [Methanomicrobiales archaeon]|nr:hypothetical protein [Methanomicrobiales archaeon]